MAQVTGLKKASDYREVYRRRRSKANRLLVLYKKESDQKDVRVGISVSKKVGNSVVRHRLKRQLREIVRRNTDWFSDGWDLVFVVRVAAKGCAYQELEAAVLQLARRQGL